MFEVKAKNKVVVYELRTIQHSFTIEFGEPDKLYDAKFTKMSIMSEKSYHLSILVEDLKTILEGFEANLRCYYKSCNNIKDDEKESIRNKEFELFVGDSVGNIYKKKLCV